MDKFEIGEIAIAVAWFYNPEYNGQEVEVIGDLKIRQTSNRAGSAYDFFCYSVKAQDGYMTNCAPEQLRKKQPPDSGKVKNTIYNIDNDDVTPNKMISWNEKSIWKPSLIEIEEK